MSSYNKTYEIYLFIDFPAKMTRKNKSKENLIKLKYKGNSQTEKIQSMANESHSKEDIIDQPGKYVFPAQLSFVLGVEDQ